MPWNINLWHDIYKSLLCILNKIFYIFLCIKPTVIARFIICGLTEEIKLPGLFHVPSTDFCQLRQTFNFNSPPLVICKMQVKHVEFVANHIINEFFYFLFSEEVPRHIKHQSSPTKTWLIHDTYRWHSPGYSLDYFFAFNFIRQQLQ